jgi:hypothetical protein
MEERELTGQQLAERRALLDQIAAAWERQTRGPSADEIESWIETGRPTTLVAVKK